MTSIRPSDARASVDSPRSGRRIAYLVSRFPHLPETFILREIDHLEALGHEVVLCPLLRQHDEVVHPAAERWIDRAHYTPFVSAALLRDLTRVVVRDPRAAARGLVAPLARVWRSSNFLTGTAGILTKVAHLARVLERQQVDHIHAHFATHPAMAAYMLHQLTGLPYSFTVHAHDLYVDTTMLERKIEAASFVVTISDYNRRLLERFGSATPIHVVRSGVDLDRYPVGDGARSGRVTFVSVGSLQPYKGFRYLIDAVGMLVAAGRGDEFRLRIVGGGPDRDDLERRISELGVDEQVELLGPRSQDEVAAVLREADAFVLPSIVTATGKMEGLPVVLMEALATGLPTISTSISGIPELIRHGETGQLVPPQDAAHLADAIRWVIDEPDEARAQGRRGRSVVEREHRLQTNVASLAALLDGKDAS